MAQSLLSHDDIWELALNSDYVEVAGNFYSRYHAAYDLTLFPFPEPAIRAESLNEADTRSKKVISPGYRPVCRTSLSICTARNNALAQLHNSCRSTARKSAQSKHRRSDCFYPESASAGGIRRSTGCFHSPPHLSPCGDFTSRFTSTKFHATTNSQGKANHIKVLKTRYRDH